MPTGEASPRSTPAVAPTLVHRLSSSARLAWSHRREARFPFRDPESIRRVQSARVRAAVDHAVRTVPHYREAIARLGLSPADFRTAEDLARLPFVERRELQRDPERFLSSAFPKAELLRLSSGGSTGAPCTVFHDPQSVLANSVHGERERSIVTQYVGRRFGYREAVLAGNAARNVARTVQEFSQAHSLVPAALRLQRRYVSLLDPIDEVLAALDEFRPDVLHSVYGSYLDVLFPYLLERGRPFHRPKVITYSSDHLSDAVRQLIQSTFGIPVLATYQSIEAFKIGFECDRHTGLHLNADLYPLRVIDEKGRSLPPGETGEVVISNLVDRATVLLNYRLGDLAALSPQACPCGRKLPLLSFLQGRSDEWLTLGSGLRVHPQAVRRLFAGIDELWEYQVVQEGPSAFRVLLVTAPGGRPEIERRIGGRFAETFGEDARVRISFVDAIERTAAGKLRTVVAMRGEA